MWTGKTWTATLEDDGKWKATNPVIQTALETEFSSAGYSEAHGVFGRRMLAMAAERWSAKLEYSKPSPPDGYYPSP